VIGMDKLTIHNEMMQLDRKNRGFYDSLDDTEKKKFSPFLMLRWGSAVQGGRELQEFYVIATNQQLNRHFFSIPGAHRKLQWLMATAVSPDMGSQKHYWIAPQKKISGSKKHQMLREMYPDLDDDDIDVLAEINPQSAIDDLFRAHGRDIS
jgi:hypothetical protein